MYYLKTVIILIITNNICTDSPHDIGQYLIDIGLCFQNRSSKIKIFISGILPRECYLVNRMLIKEINTILKCKCAFHSFNFIEQEQDWIDKRHTCPFTILPWKAASNTKRKYQAIRVNYNSYRRQKYWSKYSSQQDVKQET